MGEDRSVFRQKIVISLGGSLIVPNGGIDTDFLKKFNSFLRSQLKQYSHRQFFIVAGGGATARRYRDAGRDVLGHELSPDDLDWLGIHATKLNAHLIRTIFRDIAHPYVLKHYEIIRKVKEPVVVAAGWKPGWSTDYCATMVCEDYDVGTIVNLSNIDMAYDKDPREHPDATPIKDATWNEFREIVGSEWIPGMNMPFDPIASRKAQELGLTVVIVNGRNFENLEKYFESLDHTSSPKKDTSFVGTVIR